MWKILNLADGESQSAKYPFEILNWIELFWIKIRMQGKECESLKCCHDCPADTWSNKKLFFSTQHKRKERERRIGSMCVIA